MKIPRAPFLLVSVLLPLAAAVAADRPGASVREEMLVLPTYGFGDPDPVPCTQEKRYPYFRYDGSSALSAPKAWRAVVLENEHVKVTMLPEIGGKVWGAVDKKTGREFIYFNHAVKFRNIAMRGPWCSGGIEFNFGIMGHSPTTATPVDWCTRMNPDGSASCFVSATEYINRTTWQVEVRLNPGEDQFHTYTTWFNGSNLCQPYYQWMTAAYSARGNPQLFFPGDAYIGHEGDAHAWPVDGKGRDLSRYENNAFGSSKSYHVLNGDNRMFAVWWPEEGVGSIHANTAYDKYGRKIWLWALSRAGGIWEDLLTDTDGQYVELQSGRVFNQPRGETYRTPFKHPTFMPGGTDVFHERWGVVRDVAALQAACSGSNYVARPLQAPANFNWNTAYGHFVRGEQALRERDDRLAEKELRASLAVEPDFAPALVLLAEIELRRGHYGKVSALCAKALAVNTYDPMANYLDGLAALSAGAPDLAKARERLGLAAFSPACRASAYCLTAFSHMREGDWTSAVEAADRALLANPLSRDAALVKIVCARRAGQTAEALRMARQALRAWPLFHGAQYELQLLDAASDFPLHVRNELPEQSYLELALWYREAGLEDEALQLLGYAERSPIARILEADIHRRNGRSAESARALSAATACPAAGAFPFRRETAGALLSTIRGPHHWKFDYWTAVLLDAQGETDRARGLLNAAQDPDEAVFFLFRARLRKGEARLADLFAAQSLAPADWRVHRDLAQYFDEAGEAAKMLLAAEDGLEYAPANNALQMLRAKALVKKGDCQAAVDYLRTLNILPSEHKDNAHEIWVDAWKGLAAEARRKGDATAEREALRQVDEYPENLGAGKPFPNE